jgi:hypothetical protein
VTGDRDLDDAAGLDRHRKPHAAELLGVARCV